VAIGIPILAYISATYFASAFLPETKAAGCVEKVRLAVRDTFGSYARQEQWQAADECVHSIAPKRFNDRLTAMVYAASRHEKKESVTAGDLAVLTRSPYARHKAFASVYLEPQLSRAKAEQLVRQMPDTSFVYELAKVHALERAGVAGQRSKYLGKIGLDVALIIGLVLALGGVLIGLCLWVTYAGLRAAGMLRPLGHPLGDLRPSDGDRCALRAAQYLIAYIGASLLATLLVPAAKLLRLPEPTDSTVLIAHELILVGVIIWLAAVPLGGKRLTLTDIGIARQKFGIHVAWGLGGLLANLPFFCAVSLISNSLFSGIPQVEHPVLTDVKHSIGALEPILLFIGASLLAPLVEETWFRGTLLPALSTALKRPVWGIVASSLFFAALHPTGLPSWLPLASIGAMGAMLTYQTKSLVPAMVMHAAHNGITLVFALLMS
jgi:hypothetical protein